MRIKIITLLLAASLVWLAVEYHNDTVLELKISSNWALFKAQGREAALHNHRLDMYNCWLKVSEAVTVEGSRSLAELYEGTALSCWEDPKAWIELAEDNLMEEVSDEDV